MRRGGREKEGGTGAKVVSIYESYFEASAGSIESNAGAASTTADDEEIILVVFLVGGGVRADGGRRLEGVYHLLAVWGKPSGGGAAARRKLEVRVGIGVSMEGEGEVVGEEEGGGGGEEEETARRGMAEDFEHRGRWESLSPSLALISALISNYARSRMSGPLTSLGPPKSTVFFSSHASFPLFFELDPSFDDESTSTISNKYLSTLISTSDTCKTPLKGTTMFMPFILCLGLVLTASPRSPPPCGIHTVLVTSPIINGLKTWTTSRIRSHAVGWP